MSEIYYIGYKNKIGTLASSGLATGIATGRVLATGGADISADIALVLSSVQFGTDLFTQWTSHPARDAQDFIKNAKPKIAVSDPYNRLIQVIGYSDKINPRAIDVNAREWLQWYKQNYPNDYTSLTPDAKIYWNNYLDTIKSKYNNPNNMNANLDLAKFTDTEINYNATPVETVSNLFTSTNTGNINWILYGAIGIGAILLIKILR